MQYTDSCQTIKVIIKITSYFAIKTIVILMINNNDNSYNIRDTDY